MSTSFNEGEIKCDLNPVGRIFGHCAFTCTSGFMGALASPVRANTTPELQAVAIAAAGLTTLLVVCHWLLDPFFRTTALSRTREVLITAALSVFLGALLFGDSGWPADGYGGFHYKNTSYWIELLTSIGSRYRAVPWHFAWVIFIEG